MKKIATFALVGMAAIVMSSGTAFAKTTPTTTEVAATENAATSDNKKTHIFQRDQLEIAAELLGITKDELTSQLQKDGNSLYTLLTEADKLDEYKEAVLESQKDKLDEMVSNNKINQTEADEMYAKIQEQLKTWDGSTPEKENKAYGKINILNIKLSANLLGITEEALQTKLQDGDNLYTLLKEADKLDEYITAVLETEKTRLAEMVTEGKIDQTQADEMYAKIQEHLENWDGSTPEKELTSKTKEKTTTNETTSSKKSNSSKTSSK